LAEQNGLLVDEDLLIMQGEIGKLKYINIDTKSLSTISDSLDIPIDGITKYRDIGYIVSNWGWRGILCICKRRRLSIF